jgi:hypothetical protein
MNDSNWTEVVENLLQRISKRYSVPFSSRILSEKLTRYDFIPPKSSAASLSLFISPFEVIVMFGSKGERIELSSLPGSENQLMGIVEAIAEGRFVETRRRLFSRYRLDLNDGTVLRGGSVSGVPMGSRVQKYESW